jgi:hypothetical protein
MSSEPKKGFIHYFRAGVKFSERFVKNLIIQIKWIWETSKKLHGWLLSLHPIPRHYSLPWVYGVVVAFCMMIITIPIFIWAMIKSI